MSELKQFEEDLINYLHIKGWSLINSIYSNYQTNNGKTKAKITLYIQRNY